MMQLKKFKTELTEKLLTFIWNQWNSLGFAGHEKSRTHCIIDPESLVLATTVLRKYDKRLFSALIEWLNLFNRYINISRFRNIAGLYLNKDKYLKRPLIKENVFREMKKLCGLSKEFVGDKSDALAELKYISGNKFSGLRNNSVITEPLLIRPELLILRMREVFGINARAETAVYLLNRREGNSNQIAREIYYDQKNIYRILESWVNAGFLEKRKGTRAGIYRLLSSKIMIDIGTNDGFYINQADALYLMTRICFVMHSSEIGTDRYLVSSFFRDIRDRIQHLSEPLKIDFPDIREYQGEDYYEPFSEKILQCIVELNRFQRWKK